VEFFLFILVFVTFIYLKISSVTFKNVKDLGKASLSRSPVIEPPSDENQWAEDNDFYFIGNFTMKTASINSSVSAWQHRDRPTFFCKYVVKVKDIVQQASDFITKFANDISLTTASTSDANSFPGHLEAYLQTFSKLSLDERWYRHVEMENYLIDTGGAGLIQMDVSFEKEFSDASQKRINYICSIPLWPFRGAYWYFVRRHLWHNKSIKTQHEKGMIKLPNQLTSIRRLRPDTIWPERK
jgi:hypothetical protein